jgi:ATP-binding cassette subfamily F protein 3
VDFDIDRGDRIAFVGVNGAGKSTLARIIAGVEPFDAGEREPGHNMVISYFAQHQAEELNPRYDVLQTVDEVATGEIRKGLRNLLGCFLFSGDDVFKKVGVLSGGEKSRLALAKMLLQPANLIVMDEPTNHLDMRSKGVLQEALAGYGGSFVIVSHDRDFLDPIVTKVVEFRRGRIKTYLGNVSDYLTARDRPAEERRPAEGRHVTVPPPTDKERKRLEAEERQRRYTKTKPVQEKITKLEKQLEGLEREKTHIEQSMTDPDFYRDGDRVKAVAARYREIERLLADGYFRWNELSKEYDRLAGATDGGTRTP